MIARVPLGAFALALASSFAYAAPSFARDRGDVRAKIDALCVQRDTRARDTEPKRFARVFAASSPAPVWRVADAQTLARIEHDPDIYSELASVWRDREGIATVAIAVRSLDYHARTSYCFRPSGSLARIDETSSGTTNVDRELRYFDDGGAIVGSDSKLSALFPQPNFTISPDVVPAKPDLYRTVRALPFFGLLDP